MTKVNLQQLLNKFRSLPSETEWIEFKVNNKEPQLIGEYVSALSNSACLQDEDYGYLIFGIEDKSHDIIGTDFSPKSAKGKGNEGLEPWLARLLTPRIDFRIFEDYINGKKIVIFQIEATVNTPVKFKEKAYIRIGEHKHNLSEHPEKQRKIWNKTEKSPFEMGVALENQTSDDVLKKIDYPAFCDLLKIQLPDNRQGILEKLLEEKVILSVGDTYSISNLGAILFAKKINYFPTLEFKAPRVIVYNGDNNLNKKREQIETIGYAISFKKLIEWICDQLPENEIIKDAVRVDEIMYPKVAIREFVANAIIHQDFSFKGSSVMIEVFDSRIEITNPGSPLVDVDRFIDHAPVSRNEHLAHLMRRMNLCEVRGSGIDRAIAEIEIYQLPAPEFRNEGDFTKVILYAYKELNAMTRKEKTRACYQHCCLRWVLRDFMTNSSLRNRFKIEKQNYSTASRLIKETLDSKFIKIADSGSKSNRDKKYIPFWG